MSFWRGNDSSFREPRRWVCATILLLAHAVGGLASAREPQVEFVERPEEEILILAVRLNNRTVSQGIVAYQLPDGSVLLPLGEIARLTTLAVETDPDRGRASGFLIRESRPFTLDAVEGWVEIEGERRSLPPGQVEIHESDIFVRAPLIEEFWPLDLEVDLPNLILEIESTEPLPYELREKRGFRGRLLEARTSATGLRYPLLPDPYDSYQVPVIDLDARLTLDTTGEQERTDLLHTISAAGDLLGASARLFVTGTDHVPFDFVRGTLGRWDPDGHLLGPLRATLAEAGEVQNPGSELLLRSTTGPGLHVSNYPLFLQDRLESHTFRGEIPAGWEVELYQNDVLVGLDRSDADGLYEFEEIPLIAGLNVFRLVFYGPRGETREEIVRFNLLDTIPERGELLYRIVAHDARTRDNRALVETEVGLGRLTSLRFTSAYEETEQGENRTYYKAGVRRALAGFFVTGEGAWDQQSNLAAQVRVNGRLSRWDVALGHVQVSDFSSEDLFSGFGELRSRSSVAVDGPVGRIGRSVFNSRLDLVLDRLEDGSHGYTLNHRMSANVQRFFLSNILDRRWTDGIRDSEDFTRGILLLSRPDRALGLRGELTYELEPTVSMQAASLTADIGRWRPFLVQLGLDRIEVPEETNQFRINLQRRGRTFSWGLNLIADDEGDATVLLSASTTAFHEPRTGDWAFRGDVARGTAAVSVTVFLDGDHDGVIDSGEWMLPGVEFFVGRLSYSGKTDDSGRMLITNLGPFRDTEITLSRSSLPQATMVPVVEGHAVRLRPGRVVEIEFPVILTGEITGTVYHADGEPAGGIPVELIDRTGKVVGRTASAYDGFFELLEIPVGVYRLRASRRGKTAETSLTLSGENPYLDGLTLVLSP